MHLSIIINSMLFLFYLLISFSSKKKEVDSLLFQVYKLYLIATMWVLLIVWLLVAFLIPFIFDESKSYLLAIIPIVIIIINLVKLIRYKMLEERNRMTNTSTIEKLIVEKSSYLPENIKFIKVEPFVVTIGGHISGQINVYLNTENEVIVKQDIEVWYQEVNEVLNMSILINVFINNEYLEL